MQSFSSYFAPFRIDSTADCTSGPSMSLTASSLGSCCNNDLTSSTLPCFIASSSGEDSITVLHISLSDSVLNTNYSASFISSSDSDLLFRNSDCITDLIVFSDDGITNMVWVLSTVE